MRRRTIQLFKDDRRAANDIALVIVAGLSHRGAAEARRFVDAIE